MNIIELEGIKKTFHHGRIIAVNGVTLAVKQAEIMALLGPSGGGKTTLLRVIAGFDEPDAGTISIAGKLVVHRTLFVPPERRGVGMVFQDYALFPHLNVRKNVAFGLSALSSKERAKRMAEVLDLVGLSSLKERYPHELSGGQQQRVALARALAPYPPVILLDEPFSNLDADTRAQMRQEVRRILVQTSTSALLVTHDQEEAFDFADRVGVLNSGKLEQLDRPEVIYHQPATRFVADFVGQADFIPGLAREGIIVTEIGALPLSRELPPGVKAEVMVRPDDVDIFVLPDGKGEIVARQFRGSENLYAVKLPSGQIVHSAQPSTVIYPIGTRVEIKANLTHVVAFPF